MRSFFILCLWTLCQATLLLASRLEADDVASAPLVPALEPLSPSFKVTVGPTEVPVYLARVSNLTVEQRRSLGMPVSESTAETSFSSFDLAGNSVVTVTCPSAIQTAKILPSSSGITPMVSGNQVAFSVSRPGALTLEVNGGWISSLELFVNPPETNIPKPDDPNVIYYGPGVHEVEPMEVGSGKTIYLAPGSVIYGKTKDGKPGNEIFRLTGSNITLRGRGIIDGSLCPRGSGSILGIYGCRNVQLEGIILRDSCGWTMPVRRCDQVKIDNVKVFGWRGNSDGMDICNSRQVEVSDSFLRTFDDLIVIKSDKGQGESSDITVRHCVLWNEFAHALSLGAELREPVTNVRFTDCDIIHDKGREWLLRVYNCDSAAVKNVVFDDIRIEEARRLMSIWIGKTIWSKQPERGQVENVSFQNITSVLPESPGPTVDLVGFDADHAVDHVGLEQVLIGGKPLVAASIRQNEFVHHIDLVPLSQGP